MTTQPLISRFSHYPAAVERFVQNHNVYKKIAYVFDGEGNFTKSSWNLGYPCMDNEFTWHHVMLPVGEGSLKPTDYAVSSINLFSPPLKLAHILALVSDGSYCDHVDGDLVFRLSSHGPLDNKYSFRVAAVITQKSVISVSFGNIPNLWFYGNEPDAILFSHPIMDESIHWHDVLKNFEDESRRSDESTDVANRDLPMDIVAGRSVITRSTLDKLLNMSNRYNTNLSDQIVPKSVSNLVVHILEAHLDHLRSALTEIEILLDAEEVKLARGSFDLKKMLRDRRFPKMRLDLQRLLQIIAQGEDVFPRMKANCCLAHWFNNDEINKIEELIGSLGRLKASVGFTENRVAAIQGELGSWQAEQINNKLYVIAVMSLVFLPLATVVGAFGMNVGGVPWTEQKKYGMGFLIVMGICFFLALGIYFLFKILSKSKVQEKNKELHFT